MDIDARKIILAFATVLGVATIFSFTQVGLFSSPITTSAVVLAAAVGVLFVTYQTGDREIEVTGTILGGVGVTAAVLYSVLQLASGGVVITLSLGILTVMFLGVAYVIQSDDALVKPNHLKIAFGVTIILAIIVVGVDVTMASPQVQVSHYDGVQEVSPNEPYHSQYAVGEIVILNNAPLPQPVDRDTVPSHQACLTGVEASKLTDNTEEQQHIERQFEELRLSYDTPYDPLMSYASHHSYLQFPEHFASMIEQSDAYSLSNVSVQTAESCPEATENPTVTIIERDSAIRAVPA